MNPSEVRYHQETLVRNIKEIPTEMDFVTNLSVLLQAFYKNINKIPL